MLLLRSNTTAGLVWSLAGRVCLIMRQKTNLSVGVSNAKGVIRLNLFIWLCEFYQPAR